MNKLKVIKGGKVKTNVKCFCNVNIDNEVIISDNFVAVTMDSEGNASMSYNADIHTVSVALELIKKVLENMWNDLSDVERGIFLDLIKGVGKIE